MAAALERVGGLLGVQEFPATPPAMPGCWPGCAGSAPCTWSASRAPAATAPALIVQGPALKRSLEVGLDPGTSSAWAAEKADHNRAGYHTEGVTARCDP